MAVVLSPAPTTPAAMQAARDYLGPLIGVRDDDRLDHLLAVAAALIEKEAPAASQAVKNEASTRFCGYLSQARPGADPAPTARRVVRTGIRREPRADVPELRSQGVACSVRGA